MAAVGEGKSLPELTGTLTFLFADLRDYTAFVEAHGDAAATSLIADYRRLVRSEVARHAGAEIKTEGDSFYVTFQSARQALRCAIGILREAEHQSRPERPIRVGVGLHAGEPLPHEGQYVGSAVNLASRLASAAGPGELLVSEIVRGLLRTSGAPPMAERTGLDLKGVADPPRVFVVSWRPAERPQAAAPREVAIEAAPPIDRRILCPELVGREAELAALEAFLQETRAGSGRTVLLSGEAGIGKSAALRAFAGRARGSGARVLLGECTEVEARRPFGPFLVIVRAALRELSSTTERAPATGADLRALLPELGHGELPSESVGEEQRYRVHEAIARLLGELAQRGPLVVAVDDLHWADEATLELFPYLARKLRTRAVLLLGTYRSDELRRTHPLRRALAELARVRLGQELTLRRLTLQEVGALLRSAMRLNREPTPAFRQAMHERCEGNPFFIEEVLKALVERGDISYREGAWRRTKEVPDIALPDSIRDTVQQRLRQLSAKARRAIQLAAVIGGRFEFELLRRISGLSEEALLVALRAAVEAQLVEEVADSGAEELYAFRHALTRESVLAELLQRERRLLHKAVGEAIEAVPDASSRAEELAYHFDQARDADRAFRYHQLAAAEAMRLFAFARATQHLERALELAPEDDPALADLQLQLAAAASPYTDFSRGVRAAEEARRLFEARGDIRRLGDTLRRLSRYRWWLGETHEAQALAQQAVELLAPLGESPELAHAYAESAALAGLAGRYADAIALAKRAIDVARATGAVEPEALGLNWVGTAMVRQGQREGLGFVRRSIELALRHDLVWEAQRGYFNLHVSLNLLGAPHAEARAVFEDTLRHARQFGLRSDGLPSLQCAYALVDGDWDRLLALVEEYRGESIWSAARDMLEAAVEGARQGPERGLKRLEAPRARLLAAGDPQWVDRAVAWSAYLHLLAGGDQEVLAEAERAADLVRQGLPLAGLGALCALLAARRANDAAALGRWVALTSAEEGARPKSAKAVARFAAGICERRDGAGEAALEAFAQSAELFDDSPVGSFASTLARLERADLLVERGDREAAAAELARVVPFWRKAKATWYLGQLREWAEERSLPFPGEEPARAAVTKQEPAAIGLASGLTAREREVAVLVARGLTNKQIAERLVISERTAEGHVEQVRNKLGFHSRTQIATWVAEEMPGVLRRY